MTNTTTAARFLGVARRAGRSLAARSMVAAVSLATLGGVAGEALAQAKKNEPLRPPTPPTGNTDFSSWKSLLIAVGIGALIFIAAFIPSKRGHQD